MATEWVAWGFNPRYASRPIKLTGGTLAHCRAEVRTRSGQPGWSGLAVYRHGTAYSV